MLTEILELVRSNSKVSHSYEIGALLFARGDDVETLFLLEEGEVKLSRSLVSGKELVLHRVRAVGILAEASVYSASYHCDALCLSRCVIRKLPISRFLNLIERKPELSSVWSAHLAHALQSARYRSEILTMKKVSERLDAWLDWHDGCLPVKGKWKEVAAEIGVSPEALYRELASRKI